MKYIRSNLVNEYYDIIGRDPEKWPSAPKDYPVTVIPLLKEVVASATLARISGDWDGESIFETWYVDNCAWIVAYWEKKHGRNQ